jgi:hypothetical protein
MRIAMMFLAAALAVAPACKKKTAETTEGSGSAGSAAMGSSEGSSMAGSGSAGSAMMGSAMGSAAGSAAMGSGAGSADQAMAHHAGMCPSTVFGSTTTAAVKGKDVVVTISSDDKDAIMAIQKRTDEMLKARMGKHEGEAHDQRGTHGGKIGLCPLHIPEGATAKSKNEKNGVTVTITPKDKPDELKTEIDGRIQKAADWVKANIKPGDKANQGGVGGGKNNEGMNRSGSGDAKGIERKKGDGSGTGGGGGKGTGAGTGGGKK